MNVTITNGDEYNANNEDEDEDEAEDEYEDCRINRVMFMVVMACGFGSIFFPTKHINSSYINFVCLH